MVIGSKSRLDPVLNPKKEFKVKCLKRVILFFCVFIMATVVQAETKVLNITVPFQNILLNPGGTLLANYSFGNFSVMFCFANDGLSVLSVGYTFQGVPKSISFPVFFKTKAIFDGTFADPNGLLAITNSPNNGVAIVNCVFAI